MAITTFSLPVDIPWQRIAFSADMTDRVACDRAMPLRWRSSIAVFSYEPPLDQQRTDGFVVSYLKVACTITGFQGDAPEIRMRERLARSGWKNADLTNRLGEAAAAYYPCQGAILEVVVAPHENDNQFTLADYPYFADFDPKKRELYEVVTDTGEVMSRSLEDVSVRHGQTTLQSHEVRDMTTLGASLTGGGGGASATGSISNTSGTTDLSQQGSENVRTSDAARENRETFSHTTQLSQLYHQLDSYHLGTNRAAFFVLPRPHTVQSPATFVNGPREIEGVQEFMLVVVRPKAMEHFCVEAYLETAHLTGEPDLDWDPIETQVLLHVDGPPPNSGLPDGSNSASNTARAGYVIDTSRGALPGPPGGIGTGPTVGYEITSIKENNVTRVDSSGTSSYSVHVGTEQVTFSGTVSSWGARGNRPGEQGALDLWATVYLRRKEPVVRGYKPGLMITGRAVCSCPPGLISRQVDTRPSVVFEKALTGGTSERSADATGATGMSMREANRLGASLKHEMVKSLSSADRYPRGTVGLLESQRLAEAMGQHIVHADRDVNPRVGDWPTVDAQVVRRIHAYAPAFTRADALLMPLPQQVERFGLTFEEAVALRRALVDLPEPNGPPPVPERVRVEVPLLIGLRAPEARAALARVGLLLGAQTVQDSPLTSNTVTEQRPPAGAAAEAGSEVTLVLASGLSVRLPEVLGLRLTEAACRIRESGLQSEPSVEGQLGPTAVVVEMDPPPGTLVTPNAPVTVTLKRRSRATAPR
jgi:hypothetical protein